MSTARIVAWLCIAEIMGMAGYSIYPALLPDFVVRWGLTNTQAGWIGGIYFAGYTAAVLVLVGLTDRIDARRVYLASMVLAALSNFGFAYLADGLWTALVWRALGGIALAGTYMPGLKALTGLSEGAGRSRIVAWYTSSFGLGAGISFLFAGAIDDWLGWRSTFAAAGIAAALASAVAWRSLPRAAPRLSAAPPAGRLLDFRPVIANRPALGYILGYASLTWGLSGLRVWLVAFLAFSLSVRPADGLLWSAVAVAAAANLIGVPVAILGNELCIAYGMRRAIVVFMVAGAVASAGLGLVPGLPYLAVVGLCLVYAVMAQPNMSSITSAAVAAAPPERLGATMALQSFLGFSAAFLSPLGFGLTLDLAGGNGSSPAWALAWVGMGAAYAAGAAVVAVLCRGHE